MPLRSLLILLLLCSFLPVAKAQTNLETFGKNRVQFRKFEWKYYDNGRFRIFHYDRGGRELARYVSEQAEQDVRDIERAMAGSFPSRLNVILYNSYDDYLQTNIGLETELMVGNEVQGSVNFVGDKLVVYYDGVHAHLKEQLRRGMAKVVVERALFGNDLRDFARNTLFQNVPAWLSDGYVDYSVYGWDAETDEAMKQLIYKPKVYFNNLTMTHPEVAGRALWKFLAERYGSNKVKEIASLVNQKGNLNRALKDALEINQKKIYDSLIIYYKQRYAFEQTLTEDANLDTAKFIITPTNAEVSIRDIKLSPRGSDVAYVEWENGQYRVILEKTLGSGKTIERRKSTVLSGGVIDHTAKEDANYPLLGWSNTGFKLGMMYQKKNKLYIKVYNSIKASIETFRIRSTKFDRVQSFTFMEDDELIILSAIKNGQSDLFEYRLKGGRITQLTDDTYDDVDPVFVSGGVRKGIVFRSNRPQPLINIKPLPNELPNGPLKGFFYNSTTKSYQLLQLTNGEDEAEQLIPYGIEFFSYLSSKSGIKNRYVVLFGRNSRNFDTAYSLPTTNYSTNIISQQYNPASAKIAEAIQRDGVYRVYFKDLALPPPAGDAPIKDPLQITGQGKSGLKLQQDSLSNSGGSKITITSNNISLTDDGSFQTKFTEKPKVNAPQPKVADTLVNEIDYDHTADGKRILYVDSSYIKLRSKKYFPTFFAKTFTLRFDKSVVFNRYQSYTNNGGSFQNPDLGGLSLVALNERMEDYRITGGVKLASNFSPTFLLKYENLRRRIDWGATIVQSYLRNEVIVTVLNGGQAQPFRVPTKSKMTTLQADLSYPLDRVNSVKATVALRLDNLVFKAKEFVGLLVPDVRETYSMNRLEFVHDDTRSPALNIYNGSRYKIFGEFFSKLQTNNEFLTDNNGRINDKLGGFYNFGFDLRYYKPIYKNFIFAIRGAGAHSGGGQQILYTMGGVDNSFSPQYNNLLQPTLKNTYAFQSLVTNLRGYSQNARNGNTYALVNAELRLPVFATFLNRPINASFVKDFQVIAFLDAGSAWEGLLPDNNLRRSSTFYYPDPQNAIVTAKVPYAQPNGLAMSYGLGLRTSFYSYFLRVDGARNIEGDYKLHISIGTDF